MSAHWSLDNEQRAAVAYRLLVDAWLDGNRMFWERRAQQLEAARPRRGEFTGNATSQDLQTAWHRLTEAAAACRARAQLTDVSRAQAEETLTDLASGAAA